MAAFERVVGKKVLPVSPEWLQETASHYDQVVFDIGTGDGRFVLDGARGEPAHLWLGIDPVAETLAKVSRIAAARPKKGGVPNAFLFRGAAEQLPGPFRGLADRITINYPWNSLLRIVCCPEIEHLANIAACGKPGSSISLYINYSVFEDSDYLIRLGLDSIEGPATSSELVSAYLSAGLELQERRVFSGDPPFRTRWGRQLIRGSDRKTLVIDARVL